MMRDEMYPKLAKVLNNLPDGFLSIDDGTETNFFKERFAPEEADLLRDLRLCLRLLNRLQTE